MPPLRVLVRVGDAVVDGVEVLPLPLAEDVSERRVSVTSGDSEEVAVPLSESVALRVR